MENLIYNIKQGATSNAYGHVSGYDLAQKIADEHEKKTGNKCLIRRVIDYIDQFNGRDREHFSFDIVEIIDEQSTSASIHQDVEEYESVLYRVKIRKTGSVQPSGTFWTDETVYCDYDIDEARRIYHKNEPQDFGGGNFGSPARETVFEKLDTETLDDDDMGTMKQIEI